MQTKDIDKLKEALYDTIQQAEEHAVYAPNVPMPLMKSLLSRYEKMQKVVEAGKHVVNHAGLDELEHLSVALSELEDGV